MLRALVFNGKKKEKKKTGHSLKIVTIVIPTSVLSAWRLYVVSHFVVSQVFFPLVLLFLLLLVMLMSAVLLLLVVVVLE